MPPIHEEKNGSCLGQADEKFSSLANSVALEIQMRPVFTLFIGLTGGVGETPGSNRCMNL